MRAWALKLGTKYGRYKLAAPIRPVYKSKTCEVYFAADVLRDGAPVCLKIVWDRANFAGERESRSAGALDPDRVVEVLAYVTPEHGVEEVGGGDSSGSDRGDGEAGAVSTLAVAAAAATSGPAAAAARALTGAPSWEGDPARPEFAVVMPRAEGNLDKIIRSERFAGHSVDKARVVLSDLARALHHMHADARMVHGDVKPRNVVRIGGVWKLIDLDAAAPIGRPVGRKYSSAFSPPELARLLYHLYNLTLFF